MVAVRRGFRGDGEILANPIGTIPMIGGRLARATFEPDLVMTDGEAMLVANDACRSARPTRPKVVEAGTRTDDVRHRVDGPAPRDDGREPDRPLRQPELRAASATAPKPKAQLLGFRGAPGNTINDTTSYWIPNHSPKVFVEQVDVVCGVGYDRAAELGTGAARFHEIRRVVTNLGVFDFETPDHRMRLRSRASRASRSTTSSRPPGSSSSIPDDVAETRLPDRRGAAPHPRGHRPRTALRRSREVKSDRHRCTGAAHPALRPVRRASTRSCRPAWAGWPAPRLTAATSAAGGFGILAAATMTVDQLRAAIAR